MKKQIYISTLVFVCMTIFCSVVSMVSDSEIAYSLAITFGTFSYHFLMRLLVGGVINLWKQNRFDYTRSWFQQKPFEEALYKRIGVKNWKKRIPTFDTETFDIKKHSLEEIVMATCQAEVVHEMIVVLSFVPILFSVVFGSVWVFILTSLAAAGMDMVFVLLQRFNRPRLMKMMRKGKADNE